MCKDDLPILLLIILFAIIVVILIVFMIQYYREYKKPEKPKNSIKQIKYCKQLLRFINLQIVDVSKREFDQFIANRDVDKISKADMTDLIRKSTEEVKNGILFDHINFDDMIISKDYIETMIIENTIYTINRLLDQHLQENKN